MSLPGRPHQRGPAGAALRVGVRPPRCRRNTLRVGCVTRSRQGGTCPTSSSTTGGKVSNSGSARSSPTEILAGEAVARSRTFSPLRPVRVKVGQALCRTAEAAMGTFRRRRGRPSTLHSRTRCADSARRSTAATRSCSPILRRRMAPRKKHAHPSSTSCGEADSSHAACKGSLARE